MKQRPKDIELLTWSLSPYGLKVYWMLVYKGIPFKQTNVNPLNFKELEAVEKKIIPTLRMDGEWLQDSTPICQHLEKLYPEKPLFGETPEEETAILEADEWASTCLVGQYFRSQLDSMGKLSNVRNIIKTTNVMMKMVKLPWYMNALWPFKILSFSFVIKHANYVDRSKSPIQTKDLLIEQFEARIRKTGFLAGTDKPSFADLTAFAILSICRSVGYAATLQGTETPALEAWYKRTAKIFDLGGAPEIITDLPIHGVSQTAMAQLT